MEADKDGDGKLSFEEFTNVVAKTVSGAVTLTVIAYFKSPDLGYCEANDSGTPLLGIRNLMFVSILGSIVYNTLIGFGHRPMYITRMCRPFCANPHYEAVIQRLVIRLYHRVVVLFGPRRSED